MVWLLLDRSLFLVLWFLFLLCFGRWFFEHDLVLRLTSRLRDVGPIVSAYLFLFDELSIVLDFCQSMSAVSVTTQLFLLLALTTEIKMLRADEALINWASFNFPFTFVAANIFFYFVPDFALLNKWFEQLGQL